MDLSYLPDIFALTVFIGAFRPFVRRVGAHVDLWFLGWFFILLHYIALAFAAPSGFRHTLSQLIALWTVQLCGLAFVLATANVPRKRIGPVFTLELGLPILFQAELFVYRVHAVSLHFLAGILFCVPAVHLLLRREHRNRPLTVISLGMAVLGLGTLPIASQHADVVANSTLALLFLSAAGLYFIAAPRCTRGVLAAVAGLASWGLSFFAILGLKHLAPQVEVTRSLLDLPQYLVIAGTILTMLEEYVRRTERMAMHDPLTDLPNLRFFEERLIATMDEARIQRSTVACLVIDVDNFKVINDTLGHNAGDQLLRALAVRLSWHMSPRDILARTGGDEFMALLAGVNDEHHLRFIAGAMMSAASVPITIDGHSVDLRISIGIALSPDHADDIDSLRRAADRAMYSAKRRGGSLLAFAGEEQEFVANGQEGYRPSV